MVRMIIFLFKKNLVFEMVYFTCLKMGTHRLKFYEILIFQEQIV